MNISIILVEPAVPENIGASARAIKTMGFNNLLLVNPADYLCDKAKMLAHGANDILENAKEFSSFDDAIKAFDFIIGTTAKKRRIKNDYYYPEQLLEIVKNKGNTIKNIAIIFGREERGLENDEMKKCDILSTIPLISPYPSLNLSQAVMLYCYSLSRLNISIKENKNEVNDSEFKSLIKKIDEVLFKINIDRSNLKYTRIRERLNLVSEDDIHLLHSITSDLLKKI